MYYSIREDFMGLESCAIHACEPRQARKGAAVSRRVNVPQGCLSPVNHTLLSA